MVLSPFSAFRRSFFTSSGVGALAPCTSVMVVESFYVKYRLEQHRAPVPPGVYLLVQRIKCCLFLAPGLGVTLGTSFSVLRSRERCQGACPQIVLRDTAIAPDTAVIIRLRASLFPGHCATPFVVRQTSLVSPSAAHTGRLHLLRQPAAAYARRPGALACRMATRGAAPRPGIAIYVRWDYS
jgi:hypothetical protein